MCDTFLHFVSHSFCGVWSKLITLTNGTPSTASRWFSREHHDTKRKRREMSAAARTRIGDAQRKRWAASKKTGGISNPGIRSQRRSLPPRREALGGGESGQGATGESSRQEDGEDAPGSFPICGSSASRWHRRLRCELTRAPASCPFPNSWDRPFLVVALPFSTFLAPV